MVVRSNGAVAVERPSGRPAASAAPVTVAAPETVNVVSVMEPTVADLVETMVPAGGTRRIRRGLPRVPGGEPWQPVGEVNVAAAASVVSQTPQGTTSTRAPAAAQAPTSVPAAPGRPALT
ncbi:hypothetical protein GCM10023152_29520 [Agromyces bauzanensis]|uniref:Uncharacterized protein n=1 Tax=Agromyces bauzanensis TaxID=1308924 RepID=A0A917PVC7_9MICO|nr:hypothetical protein GCM10011372_35100 [Agromyces bauzanensis]